MASLFLLVHSGCHGAPEASPLTMLDRLDSAKVTVRIATGVTMPSSTVIRDSATLADLRAVACKPGDWHPNGAGTTPAGDVRVALYKGNAYVGVVSAGSNWIGVRDSAGNERFRTMTATDSPIVARVGATK